MNQPHSVESRRVESRRIAPARNERARRWAGLAALACGVSLAWGVALPRLGAWPAVAEHIATQERLEIDPSALFYTELKPSAGFAHRAERRLACSPAAFWKATAVLR